MRVHEKVGAALRKKITDDYQPGNHLPPIRDLARRFKVSPTTICQTLAVLANEGLVEQRHGSGVYVREQVDERPVGVVLELDFSRQDVSFFWRRVAQQVRLRLAERGVPSRLYAGFHQPEMGAKQPICQEYVDDVVNNRLRGVIFAFGGGSPELNDLLQKRSIPMVGHYLGSENFVAFDLMSQVRAATERLLADGRRKLALMGWSTPPTGSTSKDLLLDAFAGVLAKHGVPLNERWVRGEFQPNMPGAGWEEFREIWTDSAEKPDGLIVTDDVLFRGVARAIGEFGIRVPEQLQVFTHANQGAIEDYPFPLWRMVTDPDAAAEAQVNLLLAFMRGEPVAQRQILLHVQLVTTPPTNAGQSDVREMEQITGARSS